jgi:hypothetical protein
MLMKMELSILKVFTLRIINQATEVHNGESNE